MEGSLNTLNKQKFKNFFIVTVILLLTVFIILKFTDIEVLFNFTDMSNNIAELDLYSTSAPQLYSAGLLLLLPRKNSNKKRGPSPAEGNNRKRKFSTKKNLNKANLPRDSKGRFTKRNKPLTPLPDKLSEALVGNLLGDGHLRFNHKKNGKGTGNAQLAFTFKSHEYALHLKNVIYLSICTLAALHPWPNPMTTGKTPTQYTLSSRSLPIFTQIHSQWYNWSVTLNKYVKVVPFNIGELLTSIGLAFWIMDDGYWSNSDNTLYICTDNFTKAEVDLLISVLNNNFGLIATPKRRIKDNKEVCWRIRFSGRAENIRKLRELVQPHFIPSMLYKLNISIS